MRGNRLKKLGMGKPLRKALKEVETAKDDNPFKAISEDAGRIAIAKKLAKSDSNDPNIKTMKQQLLEAIEEKNLRKKVEKILGMTSSSTPTTVQGASATATTASAAATQPANQAELREKAQQEEEKFFERILADRFLREIASFNSADKALQHIIENELLIDTDPNGKLITASFISVEYEDAFSPQQVKRFKEFAQEIRNKKLSEKDLIQRILGNSFLKDEIKGKTFQNLKEAVSTKNEKEEKQAIANPELRDKSGAFKEFKGSLVSAVTENHKTLNQDLKANMQRLAKQLDTQ